MSYHHHMQDELQKFTLGSGRCPFDEWLFALDNVTAVRVARCVKRLEAGNFGNCKTLSNGVSELRMDFGPGYRAYFSREGRVIVLLLCGGDKSTQAADIARAAEYRATFRAANQGGTK